MNGTLEPALPDPATVRGWYDRAAPNYEAFHDRTQRKYRRIERSMRKFLESGDVLDLGCGTGRLMRGWPVDRVVGVDISENMLDKARQRGLNVVCADGHNLPFADESFDAVIAAQGVIRYMDKPVVLAEIARVLRPGGRSAIHQFGHGLSIKHLLSKTVDPYVLEDLPAFVATAQAAGLELTQTELFRSARLYPYALKVANGLQARLPSPKFALWNHCVHFFQKGPS